MYIKDCINEIIVKKIIGNSNNAILLLKEMSLQIDIPELLEYKKVELAKEANCKVLEL